MSKMKRALEAIGLPVLTHRKDVTPHHVGRRVDTHRVNYEDLGSDAAYVLLPERKPEPTPEERKAQQRKMMNALTGVEGASDHGYEQVPIEVLRNDKGILELLDMLETCRPGGTQAEEDYIKRFIQPHVTHEDNYGNVFVLVKRKKDSGVPNILWSSHTDTVHRHDGKQKVEITNGVAWTSDGSCLGADDTVGNWLMLEMIRAKVPGTYVFHREEESGGGGSSWLAREHKDWLESFDCAIALDRAGYRDVITHQGGLRCCSNAFAKSIVEAIGGGFKPDDSGVFTDTANYVDLIGECTNLSVGYFKQHGPMEHTNLGFALRLRDALLAADWSKLVIERKPGEEDPDAYRFTGFGSYTGIYSGSTKRTGKTGDSRADQVYALEEFCKEFPWIVAEFLHEQGISVDDLDLWEPGDELELQASERDAVLDDEDERW